MIKKGSLVKITYVGKPYSPSKSGWSRDDDQGCPGNDGKIALNLYEEPHVTSAGTFWMVLIGCDNCKKLIHEAYLKVIG